MAFLHGTPLSSPLRRSTQFPFRNSKRDKGTGKRGALDDPAMSSSSASSDLDHKTHNTGKVKGKLRIRVLSILSGLLQNRSTKKHEASAVPSAISLHSSGAKTDVMRASSARQSEQSSGWSLDQSMMLLRRRRRHRSLRRRSRSRKNRTSHGPASQVASGPPILPWPAALDPTERDFAFGLGIYLIPSISGARLSTPALRPSSFRLSGTAGRGRYAFNVRRKPLPILAPEDIECLEQIRSGPSLSPAQELATSPTVSGDPKIDEHPLSTASVSLPLPTSDYQSQDYFAIFPPMYLEGDDPNLEGPASGAEIFSVAGRSDSTLSLRMGMGLRVDVSAVAPPTTAAHEGGDDGSSSEISQEPLTPLDGEDLVPHDWTTDEGDEEWEDCEQEAWDDVEMTVDLGMQLLQLEREYEMEGAEVILLP